MKKTIIRAFKIMFTLALIVSMLLIPNVAMAIDSGTADAPYADGTNDDSGVTPRAEETVWYTRVDDQGRLWIRQWSLTHGIWLTDWILVG